MKIFNILLVSVLTLTSLTGCMRLGQNVYEYNEVGKSSAITFGTIVSIREVDIRGQNTGIGSTVGGLAGAGAGSYVGGGTGHYWGAGLGYLQASPLGLWWNRPHQTGRDWNIL